MWWQKDVSTPLGIIIILIAIAVIFGGTFLYEYVANTQMLAIR